MRLISARIRGYGRLVDTKINLDAKVIAIVGANEAGKTTLLKALAQLDSSDRVPVQQRSRAATVTDDTPIVTLDYALDQSDAQLFADLDLHEQPTRALVARTASSEGAVSIDVNPLPVKSVAPLREVLLALKAALEHDEIRDWVEPETVYADPNSDAARDYRSDLQTVIEAVVDATSEPGAGIAGEVTTLAQSLLDVTLEQADAVMLREALEAIVAWAQRKDPAQAVRNVIWESSPSFILFDEDDRSIRSAYLFDDSLVENPPVALANLAKTASLSLADLLSDMKSGDVARRRTALVQANRRMDTIFDEAWKQSRLSVHFELDGDQLRIELMEDGDNVTVFDERSAGLRMFVALIAFLRTRAAGRPQILLIDEAENHLHINAQADLVNMFVSQEHATKIIYTTHSPACLPPDLGTGIRSVIPRHDNYLISDVRNSFWQGWAGYSSLMFAMGASAAAFTPARNVVLAEGATEMILLPTLIRAATGLSELPYQVAPGLSEVPRDMLPKLDLEAARVAYLVDGDQGGDVLRKSLIHAGVPKGVIVDLGTPGIENLLDVGVYRAAIMALFPECNPEASMDAMADFPIAPDRGVSLAAWAESWIRARNFRAPSKVAVANWVVANCRAIPSVEGEALLKDLHQNLSTALGCDDSGIVPPRDR